jgi:methionyl-tRNA synthetase
LEKYGRDAFVFNLLYDVPTDGDWDFSPERLWNVYNSMVIWSWGNLVNRVTKLGEKYEITHARINDKWNLKWWFDELNLEILKDLLDKNNIKLYLEKRYQIVQKANEYISHEEPWKKYKDDATKQEAIECLESLLYVVKNLAILSAPVLTEWFEKIRNIFGTEILNWLKTNETVDVELWKNAFDAKEFDINLKSEIIYPRVED